MGGWMIKGSFENINNYSKYITAENIGLWSNLRFPNHIQT